MTDDATLAANLAESVRAQTFLLAQSAFETIRTDQLAADADALNTLKARVSTAEAATEDAEGRLLVLQAKYDALVAQQGGGTTPPPVARTLIGSNPPGGGTSLASVQGAQTKYGKLDIVRVFGSSPLVITGTRPLIHQSFKSYSNASLDTALADARKGDVFTYYHEVEDNIASGQITLATFIQKFNAMHAYVKTKRPDVLTCLALQAETFRTPPGNAGRKPNDYAPITADLVGIDCDGTDPKNGVYPSFADPFTNVQKWAAARGMGVCIPEFGSQVDASDATHAKRAAWYPVEAKRFLDAKVHHLCVYDRNNPAGTTFALTTANEITAWKGVVTAATN